jgi:hypothetical protein
VKKFKEHSVGWQFVYENDQFIGVCITCIFAYISHSSGRFTMVHFYAPIIKCRGHYVMAYASVVSVSVNIWFPSIIGQTPGSIDPIFGVFLGVTRGRFHSMISSAAHPRWPLYSRHLGFGFHRLEDKRLG